MPTNPATNWPPLWAFEIQVETLAHEIANSILEKYGLVKGVVLTVSKPSAPIPGIFNNVSVTLTRERSLMRGCEND
ncbi:dihydroneopterin aldolase [Paenibacillus aceti]|uniref:dihydroneopterin aldolase n=1 Tax=Paenibacillus aceti TaxID=1820010 RepID=UPI0034DEEC94